MNRLSLSIVAFLFLISCTNERNSQFKKYDNHFSIVFPKDWVVDEISNLNKSLLIVSASKEGHFMTIAEMNITLTKENFDVKSIWQIDKEILLSEYRNKYSDFVLLDFKQLKINNVEAYYFKTSFSFYSVQLQKNITGLIMFYTLLNPNNKIIYILEGNSTKEDVNIYEPIYRKTFETFKIY